MYSNEDIKKLRSNFLEKTKTLSICICGKTLLNVINIILTI